MTQVEARDAATPDKKSPKEKGLFHKLLPVLLVLVGVMVLLYPVAATQYNNWHQRQFAEKYNSQVQQAPPNLLARTLERAREYNASIKDGVPILDPWLHMVKGPPNSDPYALYESQLNDFDSMARVRVPSGDIDLPVRHGTTEPVLAAGAGHLYGTSLPVGGSNTHAVITSHTGLSNATLFDHLNKVKEGEIMYIDVYGETLAYEVDQIKIVLPTEVSDLKPAMGQDQLTLFTCTPYAVNTHRLLVRGHRVPYEPKKDVVQSQKTSFKLEPWMYGLIGSAAGGVVLFGALVALDQRKRRKNKKDAANATQAAK